MGLTTSKEKLTPEQAQRMCGPKGDVSYKVLPRLLKLSGISINIAPRLVMRAARAISAEQRPLSNQNEPGLHDILILKHRLERGSKASKARTVQTMFPSSLSEQEIESDLELLFQATYGFPVRPDSQLQSIIAATAACVRSQSEFEQAIKVWPGILVMCSSLTNGIPPHPVTFSDKASSNYSDEQAPAVQLGCPEFSIPREAVGNELLSESTRTVLASLLRESHQKQWWLLFNSYVHGKSFAACYGKIAGRGPTIIVVRDKAGHVFGGYAAEPWEKNGCFYGSGASFIFSVLPTFAVHFSSGINSNYQWCGFKFSELPNGLGFGGQVGYFSLLINDDLDSGMSRPTVTYKSPCLAGSEKFAIDQVEVWLVEELEEDGASGPQGTLLDRFGEDKHILELHGRQMHSDGYRDAPPSE